MIQCNTTEVYKARFEHAFILSDEVTLTHVLHKLYLNFDMLSGKDSLEKDFQLMMLLLMRANTVNLTNDLYEPYITITIELSLLCIIPQNCLLSDLHALSLLS